MLYFNDAVIPTLEHSKFNRNFQISLIFQQFHEQQVMISKILREFYKKFTEYSTILENNSTISQIIHNFKEYFTPHDHTKEK